MQNRSDSEQPLRVGLIALGCAKNLVDAEIMLGNLLAEGLQVINDPTAADVVIVNTCSFIDAAQEESVDTILESAELREAQSRGQALVVSGCLPQRYREELPRLLPEVDAFMGIDQVPAAADIVRQAHKRRQQRLPRRAASTPGRKTESQPTSTRRRRPPATEPVLAITARPRYIPDFATPRFRLTPNHFAYVKIAEGCNHPCSFCIIPRMRGRHRSRAQADIVEEVRQLVAEGVREINLISQDSTYYGMDRHPRVGGTLASPERFSQAAGQLPADSTTLVTLLQALNALPGDFWIRLLYTHPAHWTDDLIRAIADCPKVARYVDMPLQHIHPNMLQRMRRETSREHIEDLIARIRAGVPGIALRTTFIVGFPGETEACFENLLEFIRTTRFERLGVFTYSQETGTLAGRMGHQVDDAIKEERRERAMAAQLEVSRTLGAARTGKTLRVLVEQPASTQTVEQLEVRSWEHGLIRSEAGAATRLRGRWFTARSDADAPDIDGRVYVKGRVKIGEFMKVQVIGHTDYDLLASSVIRSRRANR